MADVEGLPDRGPDYDRAQLDAWTEQVTALPAQDPVQAYLADQAAWRGEGRPERSGEYEARDPFHLEYERGRDPE